MFTRRSLASIGAVLAGAALTLSPVSPVSPLTQGQSAYALTAKAATKSGLGSDLDRILSDPQLKNADVGLEVRNAKTGKVMYARNVNERLNPASNNKLLTSVAAMDVLGPSHKWDTTVLAKGRTRGHTLHGNLYLRGGGDPTILAKDYDALAAKVAASGIRKVHGRLVADDTYFDDERLGPFWSWDDEPYYYSAQISALTVAPNTDYDAGTIIVQVAPGDHAGGEPRIKLIPRNHYVHIVDKATTGASGSDNTLSVERRHGNNTIDVTGSIPVGATAEKHWSTVWEPTDLVASLFTDALRRHGVRVTGGHVDAATPEDAHQLAVHHSMTLAKMLIPWLKLSNNMHAEHVTKTLGAEVKGKGTWDAGVDVVLADVAKLGVDTDTIRVVDGSGLSRADLLTAHQIDNLLMAAQHKPWFKTWYDALPIACNPARFVGDTLRSRMCDTPAANNLHGKTGSLTGVSALSGYVTDGAGDPLVFSMVSNRFLASSVKDIEDAVGVELASYGGAHAKRVTVHRNSRSAHYDGSVECSWVKAC